MLEWQMSDLETRLTNRLDLRRTGSLNFPEWRYRRARANGPARVHHEFVNLRTGAHRDNAAVELLALLDARAEVLSARKFVARDYPGLSEKAQTNVPEGALAWHLLPEAFTIRDYAKDRVHFLQSEVRRLQTDGPESAVQAADFDPASDLPEWQRRVAAIDKLIPQMQLRASEFTAQVLKQMHPDDRARAAPYVRAALNEKTDGKEVGRGQPFAFYERERASEMMGIEWPWRAPERFIGFAERAIHKSRQEGKTAAEIEASVSMRLPVDEHAIERMAEARVQDQGNVTMQQAVLLTCLNGLSTVCSNAHALEAEDQRRKEFRRGQIDWANGVFAAETQKYRSDETTRPELTAPELMAKLSKEIDTSPPHLSAIDTLRDLMRNGTAYCHKARAAVASGGVDAMDALLNPGVSTQRVTLLEHISLAETTFSAVEYALGDTHIALAFEAAKVSKLGEWFSSFLRKTNACVQTKSTDISRSAVDSRDTSPSKPSTWYPSFWYLQVSEKYHPARVKISVDRLKYAARKKYINGRKPSDESPYWSFELESVCESPQFVDYGSLFRDAHDDKFPVSYQGTKSNKATTGKPLMQSRKLNASKRPE